MNLPPKAILKKLKTVSPGHKEADSQTKYTSIKTKVPIIKHDQLENKESTLADNTEMSLPVLETFKTFLYAERKKYHRRIIALFLSFFSCILLLLLIAVSSIFYIKSGINRDLAAIQQTITKHGDSYHQLSKKVTSIIENIDAAQLKLTEYTEKNGILAISSAEILDKIKYYENELQQTKTMLDEIKKEFAHFSNVINQSKETVISNKTIVRNEPDREGAIGNLPSISDSSALTLKIETGQESPREIVWQIPIVE